MSLKTISVVIAFLIFVQPSFGQIHETINVDLVEIYVSALNSDELPVENLAATDFILKVDGKNQAITHFTRILDEESDIPLTIVFLVDTSGSMKQGATKARRIDLAKSFALDVMKDIKPNDQMQVMSFDEILRLLTPMTSDAQKINEALTQLKIDPAENPGTALLAALKLIPEIIKNHSGRKLVILLSDGQNSHTGLDPDDVVQVLNRDAITVLAMGTTEIQELAPSPDAIISPVVRDGRIKARTVVPTTEVQKAKRLLRNIAENTGGYAYFPLDADHFSRTMKKFRHITRSQYLLGFEPSEKSKKEKFEIEVKCTRKDVKLRYRKSYNEQ
jgi:Ca-activated chloride channel family protein